MAWLLSRFSPCVAFKGDLTTAMRHMLYLLPWGQKRDFMEFI
jgi:hypothetical protein